MSIRTELAKTYKFPKNVTGTFGIEIETETKNHNNYPDNFFSPFSHPSGQTRYNIPAKDWEGHTDNSLRNYGIEFVLKEPLIYQDALDALDDLSKHISGIKFIENAAATSVHVHVNMLEENFLTMANFCTLYVLFENILVDFSGPTRRSNLFALPIRVAEATLENLITLFKSVSRADTMGMSFSPDQVKYAAMNIAPLMNFGSLEIRTFRGTTDMNEIKEWLGILNRLLVFSRIEGLTPHRILSSYRDQDIEFFHEVFGESSKILTRDVGVDNLEILIERNFWYAAKLANSQKDWVSLNDTFSKSHVGKKKAKVPTYAQVEVDLQTFINPIPTTQGTDWMMSDSIINAAIQTDEFEINEEDDDDDY